MENRVLVLLSVVRQQVFMFERYFLSQEGEVHCSVTTPWPQERAVCSGHPPSWPSVVRVMNVDMNVAPFCNVFLSLSPVPFKYRFSF